MSKTNKVDSREVGLIAGLNLFHFFLGTRDLHYGLWEDDLELSVQNFPQAQKRYSEFLIEHFPEDVTDVLDVGCGAGGLASELIDRGYKVQGVSPSPLLSEAAQKTAGDSFVIHSGRFEEVEIPGGEKFDLVMFSESFQYIDLKQSIRKAKSLLRPGGHILICDFFKRDNVPGKTVIGGGHPYARFQAELDASGLQTVHDIDITQQTAPNLDLVHLMGEQLMLPTMKLIGYTFSHNHPWLARLVRWKFRKKLDKIHRKYTSGQRTGAAFARHKIYKFYLLKAQEL